MLVKILKIGFTVTGTVLSLFYLFFGQITFFQNVNSLEDKYLLDETSDVNINDLEDEFSPIVRLQSSYFRVDSGEIEIDISSNEPLKIGDFENFCIGEGESENDYLLTVENLKEGENEIELAFYDHEGNNSTESITIERKQVLGKSSKKGEILWLDGDDLLAVVDKEFALPSTYYPTDLVYISEYGIPASYGRFMLREIIMEDLSKLFKDSKKAGNDLVVSSAYRSYDKQYSVYNTWIASAGYEEAVRVAALPGHSEHQLGTAIDFTTLGLGNHDYFDRTPEGIWLIENSFKYGFVLSYPEGSEDVTGYRYEPWHFRYVGKEVAKDIHENGKIPIEYLKELNRLQN